MTRTIYFITIVGAALVLAVPAFGRADLSQAPQWQQALEARSEGLNEQYGLGVGDAFTRAVEARSDGLGGTVTSVSPLDRREMVYGKEQATSAIEAREAAFGAKREAQLATAPGRDAFERAVSAGTRETSPVVVDDRFRLDPTTNPVPVTVSSGRDIEWPQIGIGLGIGLLLGLGVMLAMRYTRIRPLAH